MTMVDTVIALGLIAGGLLVVIAALLILTVGFARAATRQMPTPNAAPAPATPPQVPVRARTAAPALRVHLCVSCGTHGVDRPGEWCMPCVYRTSPVHRAEEILAEAARKADAS